MMTNARSAVLATAVLLAGAMFLVLQGCGGPAPSMSSQARHHSGRPDSRSIQMPSGSLPTLDDEVWVIVKPDDDREPSDDMPGTGAMLGQRMDEPDAEPLPLPLLHTDVSADIAAYIASVDVTQQFRNDASYPIEAVYVFPLPQNAAINGFVMTVGERRIHGILREREEAERLYEEARSQGYTASLLTQERPNVFTQSVANIAPGGEVDVTITYFHTLSYHDGWFEYVFPMTVGPRFNPPGHRDGIGAVGAGNVGGSGQATEVVYAPSGRRAGHDIAVEVQIDAGVPIEDVRSTSHEIAAYAMDSARTQVRLVERDSIPNRDFVLRYRVAGDTVRTTMLTHEDERGGFFTLMLVPPASDRAVERAPIEMVMVIDCSGSMSGQPLAQAKAATREVLDSLGPNDTFQIIRFSNAASPLGSRAVVATPRNLRRGHDYIDDLRADGGTYMVKGMRAALDPPTDRERRRYVTFMTDGYIGNEGDVLDEVAKRLGASRIFSFGVGSAPNRYLMDRMARLGNGAVAYLGLHDDADDVMGQFIDRVSRPALCNIELDFGRADVSDVYPQRVPDLFVGRPVIVSGRYEPGTLDDVTLSASVAGYQVETNVRTSRETHEALPVIWARSFVSELINGAPSTRPLRRRALPDAVREVALEYGLVSPWTAFIAVDSMTRVDAGDGGPVRVPVQSEVPEGVSYQRTVDG